MSRTARVLANVSLGYVQLALTVVVGLWLTPFILRHLGKEDFGLWSASLPILTYVGLVDFGIITILQREVAFAIGSVDGDWRRSSELPDLIGKTTRLVLWQCPLLVVAAVIAWCAVPSSWSDIRAPLAVLFGSLVVGFPLRINHALLMGVQDLAFIAKVGLVSWILSTCVTVGLMLLGFGLLSLAVSWSVAQLASQIACAIRVKTAFNGLLPVKLPELERSDATAQLRRGFWVVISQVAAILCTGSDMLVIAAVLTPLAVVPYALTGKLVTIVTSIPIMVVASAQPALSELRRSSGSHRVGEVCIALNLLVLMMSGLLVCLLIAVDRPFVEWWVGKDNFAGRWIVILLAVGMTLSHLAHSIVYTVFAFGHERRVSITTVVSGILTFVSALILVRTIGVIGAPIAAILGFGLTTLPPNLMVVSRETNLSMRELLLPIVPWLWRTVIMACACFFISPKIPATFKSLAIASTATTLIYATVMYPLALRGPLGIYVRPRLEGVRARFLALYSGTP